MEMPPRHHTPYNQTMTDIVLPTKIPTFSSLFTRYAPQKSVVNESRIGHTSSSSHSSNTHAFNLMKLPNELIELITDELSFNKKLLTSLLNRRLRLITIKKLFNYAKFHQPISDPSNLNLIGGCIKWVEYHPAWPI